MRAVVSGLLVAVFLSAATPSAQDARLKLGKVSDQTDAVLPGATVTVGPALIQPMTVVAAESGGYVSAAADRDLPSPSSWPASPRWCAKASSSRRAETSRSTPS